MGVVHHIMEYGVFVEFAPGIVGLAPNSVCSLLYICYLLDFSLL